MSPSPPSRAPRSGRTPAPSRAPRRPVRRAPAAAPSTPATPIRPETSRRTCRRRLTRRRSTPPAAPSARRATPLAGRTRAARLPPLRRTASRLLPAAAGQHASLPSGAPHRESLQVDGLAPWLLAPRPGRACCRSSSSPAAAGKVLAAPDPPAWRLTRPATSSCNKSRVKNGTRREGQQALTN
ncbi:hypothetical protein PVAP13_3KG033427 [Panicum virgatum]|uniref:Uncharacterized protein n=1 Tax=Panicum virgatum TaxID=38727 RepID=A0A8T0UQI1_PANVG|nr:hypothetical protein PVAP13_3KG033427 [Panicum virgatum]